MFSLEGALRTMLTAQDQADQKSLTLSPRSPEPETPYRLISPLIGLCLDVGLQASLSLRHIHPFGR